MKLVAYVNECIDSIFKTAREFWVALMISGYKSNPNKNKKQRWLTPKSCEGKENNSLVYGIWRNGKVRRLNASSAPFWKHNHEKYPETENEQSDNRNSY